MKQTVGLKGNSKRGDRQLKLRRIRGGRTGKIVRLLSIIFGRQFAVHVLHPAADTPFAALISSSSCRSKTPNRNSDERQHPMNKTLLRFSVTVVVAAIVSLAKTYALDSATPTPPYTNWATAATNIQQAIDVAAWGDEVVVSNGFYATGSRNVGFYFGNRVAVTKPLLLRSANGPCVTTIDAGGAQARAIDARSTNRCVYLTNGATLAGFTLTNGAADGGGGVRCLSTNATITNCVLAGNSSWYSGAGVISGTLLNCALVGNAAKQIAGGASGSTLRNCLLTGNSAAEAGAAGWSILYNCTIGGNAGGGVSRSSLFNCIAYFNTTNGTLNYDSYCTLNYCCTAPLPTGGDGNISLDPQLASDSHLTANSPCRAAGSSAYASGTDIDGDEWNDPPSMGCDEYYSAGELSVDIQVVSTNIFVGGALQLKALVGGRATRTEWSFGDNTGATNQIYLSHSWAKAGTYEVVLRAYDDAHPDGLATTLSIEVAEPPVLYVDASSSSPSPPYNSWATAATNIQDAVDAAPPGSIVLVTNGVYSRGGRVAAQRQLFNRVGIEKSIRVESVNGPEVTIIEGAPAAGGTNGDGAVRCVFLGGTNAILSGFTLRKGHTQVPRPDGGNWLDTRGGGVWGEVPAMVTNCVIT
jgi:hypothetical protein